MNFSYAFKVKQGKTMRDSGYFSIVMRVFVENHHYFLKNGIWQAKIIVKNFVNCKNFFRICL